MPFEPSWSQEYPPSLRQLALGRQGRWLSVLLFLGAAAAALAAIGWADRIVLGAVGVTVLLAVLFGLGEVRRSSGAHIQLIQGVQRVASGQFDLPVAVDGQDHLAQIGRAFNAMTTSLEQRTDLQERDREMDRAILSTLDTASIAQFVLDFLPGVLPCRSASLTVVGTQGERDGTTWVASGDGLVSRRMISTTISPGDVDVARDHPEWITFAGQDTLPKYLAPHRTNNRGIIFAYPLHEAGELIGILSAESPGRPTPASLQRFRRLADRVSKALGNSRMMDQVRALAFYDGLTRLPNRMLYRERLGQAIGRARPLGRRIAVCSLDIDHFGRINDTLGPAAGDELIREVGARLNLLCRSGESGPESTWDEVRGMQAARLGGDEFAIIIPDLDHPDTAEHLARRALSVLQEPIRLGAQEIFATASIGIAIHPEDGLDSETLHKNADVALSRAKKEGRNTIERYVATMNAEAVGRLRLERELRNAVDHGEFTLWYQPVFDLRSRSVVAAEALVRWDHPDRGLVSPAEFMQLCEESGLIVPLGEWSLRSVCTQAHRWALEGFNELVLSVNFSARQLRQPGIVRTVQDTLHETGVRPEQLMIELTESMLMEQGSVVERRLRELAEMGIALAIDDFGTGYSSLSYLKNFPVSTLKIDRSFIVDVPGNQDAATIATAIIALGKAMELEVVAEGVETREQADFLRARGCERAQGYLLGRPAPVQMFSEYLRARQRRQASA